jgi:hypothetical protein
MADVRDSAAHIPGAGLVGEGPRNIDFLLSEANPSRSRGVITLPQGDEPRLPGSFVAADGSPATAANIVGILLYGYRPVDGPVDAAVLLRDAEVTDAYLMYGALAPAAVNARLETLGIIVRAGVLANVKSVGFSPDVERTVRSGIPPAPPTEPEPEPPEPPDPEPEPEPEPEPDPETRGARR